MNQNIRGGVCVLSALRPETVVLCLPVLPRGRASPVVAADTSRCGWSQSSFTVETWR